VNVVDTSSPEITLLGDNPMTIEVGSTFTDPGATALDNYDGDLTSSIVVSGSVDTSTIGSYTLTYDVTDASGNAAVSLTRTVNVVLTLGVNTFKNNYLEIFPIPFQSYLIIKQTNNIEKILLYNILGKKIREYNTSDKEIRIDTSDLLSGIYFVRINDSNKLIKIIR